MSGPDVPAQAARAASVRDGPRQDGLAWAIAAAPLAAVALLAVLAVLGAAEGLRWLSALTLLCTAALVVADRRRLARSGRASGAGLPSAWWCLLPPVYLWRRATRLGRSRAPFWAWMGSTLLASAVRIALLAVAASGLAEARAAAERLPDCASPDVADDVYAVFDDMAAVRQAGLRAVSLGGQAEVGQGPGEVPRMRYCTGRLLASDTVEYAVDYSLERRPDQVIIRLQLRP